MKKKIEAFLTGLGVNHSQFILLVVLLCAVMLLAAYKAGATGSTGILVALAGTALNVGLFLAVAFLLQFTMAGLNVDIPNEIFRKHNTAASYYMGALFIALAMLIKG